MTQKVKNIFTCSNCDAQFSKWNGRCLECGSWGTLSEGTIDQREHEKKINKAEPAQVQSLSKLPKLAGTRIKTNIGEINQVLGGGIVSGSLLLLAGEPGIGKSTMLAQIADSVNEDFFYISGEESAAQIKARLERLSCDLGKVQFISETNAEKIIASLEDKKPKLAIIDSIQTVYSRLSPSEPGSINQIRTSTVQFLETAKKNNISIILVGHITKDGQVAGPKSLEHIVDVVLYLESERTHNFHTLKATKNRFGSVNEVGILEMTGKGFREVKNPSAVFLESHQENISGSVTSIVMEGTRPFLVEIQALVTKTVFGYPQRKASGFDLNRLQVLTAVLTKRAGLNLTNQDVILNIVGGLKINDPGLDLAVCLAIASSLLNQVIDRETVAIGEVGLGGEIRNIAKLKDRLKEASKQGFDSVIVPNVNIKSEKLKLTKTKNLKEMVERVTQSA